MADMGDPRAAVCTEFSQCLAELEPTRGEPTLHEDDKYEPSPREADLTTRVCTEDSVIALGPPELRRHLCLTAIREKLSSLAVVAGQRIAEDDYFVDYLRILLPFEIRIVPSASSWPRATANGIASAAEISVLVLRDFEHYLDPGHAYRRIVPCFQKASARSGDSSATRMLALAEELQICSLDGLERDLERLRTPLKLTCLLATPVRPHARDAALEVCFLELDWSAQVGCIVSCSDVPEMQEVGKTLRERGIAKRMDASNPRPELQEFLAQCQELLTKLKVDAVMENAQGKTLALTSTIASHRNLKRWIERRQSAEVAQKIEDVESMPTFVLVATTADIPALQRCNWDVVSFVWEVLMIIDIVSPRAKKPTEEDLQGFAV
ncbi:hypothetical protein HPB50_025497 [Hyalomma asiaticum]|uniref:Uncharacterized protein n=1 Tax=Hyalomma asiaticum TaxID=266040 RepID=A0ACB7SL06_HYAAI|nr:hypothetical protein HPB50_025497 [Hyalomma asiaticum]